MDRILQSLYYDPKQGLRGINSLYALAREKGLKVSKSQIREFLKKQELSQVFHSHKTVSYPLYAQSPFSRMQLDLLDVNNEIPRMNNQVKFIMCMIDVFSRYGFVRPLKSKDEKDVLQAFKSIIQEIHSKWEVYPTRLDSDNESSFMSKQFMSYCNSLGITQKFSEPGDFKSKGVVESWNKTIRQLIARYRTAYKTNRYIDVLNDLIEGYNHTPHSFLGASPVEAIDNPIYFKTGYLKKLDKATEYENLDVGDKVRLKVKRQIFSKGSSLNVWTTTIHVVTKIESEKYYVNDRVNPYRREELQKINVVAQNPKTQSSFLSQLQGRPLQNTERNIQLHRSNQTTRRRLNREGL